MIVKFIKRVDINNFYLYQPSDLSCLEMQWKQKEKYIVLAKEAVEYEVINKKLKKENNRYKNADYFLLNLKIQHLLNKKFFKKFYKDYEIYKKYENMHFRFEHNIRYSLKLFIQKKEIHILEKYLLLRKIKLFNEVNKKWKENYFYKYLKYKKYNGKLVKFFKDNNFINTPRTIKMFGYKYYIIDIIKIFVVLDRYIEFRSKNYKKLSSKEIPEQQFLHLYFKYYFNILIINLADLHTFLTKICGEYIDIKDLKNIIMLYCMYNQLSLIMYDALN